MSSLGPRLSRREKDADPLCEADIVAPVGTVILLFEMSRQRSALVSGELFGSSAATNPSNQPWVSVVCRKFNWPHSSGARGLATAFCASGCIRRTFRTSDAPFRGAWQSSQAKTTPTNKPKNFNVLIVYQQGEIRFTGTADHSMLPERIIRRASPGLLVPLFPLLLLASEHAREGFPIGPKPDIQCRAPRAKRRP